MAKRRRLKGASKSEFEIGSGNVYKDLGFKDADAMLAKARGCATDWGSATHRIDLQSTAAFSSPNSALRLAQSV